MHLGEQQPQQKSWYDRIIEAGENITKAVTSAQTTRDIYKINRERAKQGLPPITSADLAPSVNVGVDPRTIRQVGIPAGLIALGFLALLYLRR